MTPQLLLTTAALIALNVFIIAGAWILLIYSLIHQWDDDTPHY